MSEAPELKPCPLCGGAASVFTAQKDEKFGYAMMVTVGCNICGLSVARLDRQNPNGGYALGGTGLESAVSVWNTRADLCPPPEVLRQVWDALEVFVEASTLPLWERHVLGKNALAALRPYVDRADG